MDTAFIKGIVPPVVTPVDGDGRIDVSKLEEQIDWMIDRGIAGVLLFGSNSEFFDFEEDEMIEVARKVVRHVNHRIPVFFGIGAIRTSKCVRIARAAAEAGISAASILQPMFIKPSESELRVHFETIARSIPNTPVLLYNNPGRCGYSIPQETAEYLAHYVSNVVGMKESSGDLAQVEEFIRRSRDVGFKVLCGKDTLVYAGLAVGCVGAVCSTANYCPELVCSIYDKFIEGDLKGSLEAQFTLNPIRNLTDKVTFPAATKDMANLIGRGVGNPIPPLQTSSDVLKSAYMDALRKAGIV